MSSMENLFAIGLGLGLRVLIDFASHHNARLGGTLVGLWEGVVLHHFLDKTPMSWDPYVAFGFRIFVDFVVTASLPRLAIVLMWTSLTMLLTEAGPRLWYDYTMRMIYRRYRRVRRAIRHMAFPSLRLPVSPLPKAPSASRVRFYTISTTPSQTSSTTPVPAPDPPFTASSHRRTPRPVPGSFSDITSDSSSVHNENLTDSLEYLGPSRDDVSEGFSPLPVFPGSLITPPAENRALDPERTPTAGASSLPLPIFPPPLTWDIERPPITPVEVPPIGDIPEIQATEDAEKGRQLSTADIPGQDENDRRRSQPDPSVDLQNKSNISDPASHGGEKPESQLVIIVSQESDPSPLDMPNLRSIWDASGPAQGEKRISHIDMPDLHNIPDMSSTDEVEKRNSQLAAEPTPSLVDMPSMRNMRDMSTADDVEQNSQPVASSSRQQLPELPNLASAGDVSLDFDPFSIDWDMVETPPPPFQEHAEDEPYIIVKESSEDSDSTEPPSVISGGPRDAIIARAEILRRQAVAEEKERDRLVDERRTAITQKRPYHALNLKAKIEEANQRIEKLNARAARRYFKAHNLNPEPRTIDVHRLRVSEALRETEKAIRDQLIDGGTNLRVIVGRGLHSVHRLPVLKLALIKEMEKQGIPAKVDHLNPGVLNIALPQVP